MAAELYQVCGALNAPAKVLDQLAAAASGESLPYETLLPSIANDFTDLEMKAGDCGGAKRQMFVKWHRTDFEQPMYYQEVGSCQSIDEEEH